MTTAILAYDGYIDAGVIGRTLEALFECGGTYKGYRELLVLVRSEGGSLDGAIGVFKILKYLQKAHSVTVKTASIGRVDSAATYIFLSAGERFGVPDKSSFLFHRMAGVFDLTRDQAEYLPKLGFNTKNDLKILRAVKTNIRINEKHAAEALHNVEDFNQSVIDNHLNAPIEFDYVAARKSKIANRDGFPTLSAPVAEFVIVGPKPGTN
jgi:hypothetical protein